MHAAPLVSVIVPTKDRPELLGHALASVAGQTLANLRSAVEVVVVNDGGSQVDRLVAIFADRLSVVLVDLPVNHGLAEARNAGLAAACGHWIAFLDDDDVFLPEHLAIATRELASGAADVVYTTCLVAEQRVDPTAGMPRTSHAFGWPFDHDALLVTNYIPVTGVVARNPLRAGVRFCSAAPVQEDWRMWLALSRDVGWRFQHIPRPTVVYHRIAGARSMTVDMSERRDVPRRFARASQRTWRAHPVAADGPRASARGLVAAMYRICEQRLARGWPVTHLHYERTLPLVWRVLSGTLTAVQARRQLVSAIAGRSAALANA